MKISNLTKTEQATIRLYLRLTRAKHRTTEALTGKLKTAVVKIIRRNGSTIDAGRGQTITIGATTIWDYPDDIKTTEQRLEKRKLRARENGTAQVMAHTHYPKLQ